MFELNKRLVLSYQTVDFFIISNYDNDNLYKNMAFSFGVQFRTVIID